MDTIDTLANPRFSLYLEADIVEPLSTSSLSTKLCMD